MGDAVGGDGGLGGDVVARQVLAERGHHVVVHLARVEPGVGELGDQAAGRSGNGRLAMVTVAIRRGSPAGAPSLGR